MSGLRECRRHWPLALVMAACVFPLFAGLGRRHLWADEGDTAVLGLSILRHGVPKAWDGVTFTDSDYGTRVNADLVMVSHPWMQYYAAAASFALFGEQAWAARFPFALAGLLTIPALYFLVLRFSDRGTATLSVVLLATSVQFFLFARQSRQYGLNMLCTCLLLLAFAHLHRRLGPWFFAATAVVFFHVHPLPAVAALGALGALTLWHPPFRPSRRRFAISVAAASPFVVPWFWLAQGGLQANTTPVAELRWLVPRFAQFAIECAAVTPMLAWLILILVLMVRRIRTLRASGGRPPTRRTRRPALPALLPAGPHSLLSTAGAFLLATGLLAALALSSKTLWVVGTRHFCGVIPLGAAVSAVLVSAVAAGRPMWMTALVVVMAATNLGRITPWALGAAPTSPGDDPETVALHAPVSFRAAVFKIQLPAFLRGLARENPGTVAHAARFLNENARPGDIVITNYEWEPLYFHTRLPQGLKIMSHYPVYDTARRHGLPEYVFSVTGVRWLVWRWPWNRYREYDFERVARELERRGAVLTLAAELPETVWENRPELGFHRFVRTGHIFQQEGSVADVTADVVRVDWPEPRRAAQR